MGSTKALLLAGVVALGAATAAQAADLPPPPQYIPPPEPVEFGGWYLRGDVGVGIASSPDIRSTFTDSTGTVLTGTDLTNAVPGFARVQQTIGDAAFIDLGVGYQFNNWLRFDATAEYRTGQSTNTIESYLNNGTLTYDNYTGSVQSSVFLVNAYADLGTWWCLTPFIGAGVGTSYNRVTSLIDTGQVNTAGAGAGFGYAPEHDQFSLAYAAMAGVSYSVTPNLKLELAYRYLNMGKATSGLITCTGSCTHESHRYDLESQDIKLGMRWMFNDVPVRQAAYYPPEAPIVRKY